MVIRVGDEVRVVGYPTRYEWMKDLVGDRGVVVKVDAGRSTPVYAVSGLMDGHDLWFGRSFIEPVKVEDVA